MRVLLRLLAPLLGLAMAAAGLLLVIEVIAAWVRPGVATGLVVPWPDWRATLEGLTWVEFPVPAIAIAVAVAGLLLLLVGLLARRGDVVLDAPTPEMTVTTSPKVLARLVGRRVRTTDDVAAATVTATKRRVAVSVEGWAEPGPELGTTVEARVNELLDGLPLQVRPRVSVSVQDRKGVR